MDEIRMIYENVYSVVVNSCTLHYVYPNEINWSVRTFCSFLMSLGLTQILK